MTTKIKKTLTAILTLVTLLIAMSTTAFAAFQVDADGWTVSKDGDKWKHGISVNACPPAQYLAAARYGDVTRVTAVIHDGRTYYGYTIKSTTQFYKDGKPRITGLTFDAMNGTYVWNPDFRQGAKTLVLLEEQLLKDQAENLRPAPAEMQNLTKAPADASPDDVPPTKASISTPAPTATATPAPVATTPAPVAQPEATPVPATTVKEATVTANTTSGLVITNNSTADKKEFYLTIDGKHRASKKGLAVATSYTSSDASLKMYGFSVTSSANSTAFTVTYNGKTITVQAGETATIGK